MGDNKYSADEIAAFKAKDLRIAKESMLKSLIEKFSVEDVNEVNKICNVCDKYVNYIYSEEIQQTEKIEELLDWSDIATNMEYPIPTKEQITILNMIVERANTTCIDVLTKIYGTYKKYPTNKNSVEKIVKELFN